MIFSLAFVSMRGWQINPSVAPLPAGIHYKITLWHLNKQHEIRIIQQPFNLDSLEHQDLRPELNMPIKWWDT